MRYALWIELKKPGMRAACSSLRRLRRFIPRWRLSFFERLRFGLSLHVLRPRSDVLRKDFFKRSAKYGLAHRRFVTGEVDMTCTTCGFPDRLARIGIFAGQRYCPRCHPSTAHLIASEAARLLASAPVGLGEGAFEVVRYDEERRWWRPLGVVRLAGLADGRDVERAVASLGLYAPRGADVLRWTSERAATIEGSDGMPIARLYAVPRGKRGVR